MVVLEKVELEDATDDGRRIVAADKIEGSSGRDASLTGSLDHQIEQFNLRSTANLHP